MTGLPSRSCQHDRQRRARALKVLRLDQLAKADDLGVRIRHLDADRAAAGNGSDDAIDAARIARARSFDRFANCRNFHAGCRFDLILRDHRTRRPATSSPSTLNVRRASMS